MASSLSKYGVFVAESTVDRVTKFAKPKYRFRVDFTNFGGVTGGKNVTLEMVSAARPTRSFDEVQYDSYNSRFWVAGKASWDPIELVVRDAYDNSVVKEIYRQLESQFSAFNQTSATVSTNYLFTTDLVTLDGHGNTSERWELAGSWLVNANFGNFDYSASEFNTITLSLRFHNAVGFDAAGNLLSQGNISTLLQNISATGGSTNF